jgi:tetratricopeptide (TPR) repeat protein
VIRLAVFLFLATALPALAADHPTPDHWVRLATQDFELYTTAGEKQGRETIRHFERVREFFLQASPLQVLHPRSQSNPPLRIFQFDTEAQYKPYRPHDFNIAWFAASASREYIVIGDRASAGQASNAYGPAIHEYMHLIVRHSGLKLPTWLNEGWSDVFSTLRPMGKDTAVGDLLPDRMKALSSEPWLDFDTLTSSDEAARPGIFYAESWALAHMLYLSPEYKDNFGKFLMALDGGRSAAEACEMAFGRSSSVVFQDLRAYFDRRRIYGKVFETRLGNRETEIESTPVPEFDARLALADLLAATGNRADAKVEYARLEQEAPDNPNLAQSIGNLALSNRDVDTARQYFTKAFEWGNSDPQMCFQLAILDHEAKQPPLKIIPILERALKSKPDFTDAKLQLGLIRVDARDFDGAISILMAIPNITAEYAPPVFCGLAYAWIQTGDVEAALKNARNCRQWSKTASDATRAEKIITLVEARAKPSVAVRPREKLRRVTGVPRNLDCSPEGNRLQVLIGDKLVAFDLPEPTAVELPPISQGVFSFTCGALKPVRMGIEFAAPRSAIETSAGIVRRLVF